MLSLLRHKKWDACGEYPRFDRENNILYNLKRKMRLKKLLVGVTLPLFLSSFLFSQNLVELAKKEKARREKLKGKRAKVITNADLAKLKKNPSLLIVKPPSFAESSTVPSEQEKEATDTEFMGVSEEEKMRRAEIEGAYPSQAGDYSRQLKEKWEKAKEYTDLLSLKMNALWQEFYSLDDMTPRDDIQRAISETFQKLQKAKEEETKAREEYERTQAPRKK